MYFQTKMEILALLKIFFFFNQKRGFKLLADRRSCQKSKQSNHGISCILSLLAGCPNHSLIHWPPSLQFRTRNINGAWETA